MTKSNVAPKPANDVTPDEIQTALLQAQLDCIMALVARGVNARAAIQLVVLACATAEVAT